MLRDVNPSSWRAFPPVCLIAGLSCGDGWVPAMGADCCLSPLQVPKKTESAQGKAPPAVAAALLSPAGEKAPPTAGGPSAQVRQTVAGVGAWVGGTCHDCSSWLWGR